MIPDAARGYVCAFPCPCCAWLREQGIAAPEWSAFEPEGDDITIGARCVSCNWIVPNDLWHVVYATFMVESGYLSLN